MKTRVVTLDLIRFLAAISVVLYHYMYRPSSDVYPVFSEFAKYGYLGVPLFFIISGFVITLSANNRSAIQFGISRFVRLYPALWAGVIFTALIVAVFTGRQYSTSQILANFTLLNDYLGVIDVDGVYWTLKVELKFYACIFLLLIFGAFQKYRIWLSIWLGLTALHSISGQPFFMGWFITPSYSSFFIAGVACFLIQSEGKNPFNLFIFFASLAISSFKAFNQANEFLINPDDIDRFISVALVWAFYLLFYFLSTGKINIAERKSIILLGALTYPLYLIHNMAGKAIIDFYSDVIPEEIMIIIVIGLMLIISLAIHLIIERRVATPLKTFLLKKFSSNNFFNR